jgi:hypothetical protein
VLDNISDLVGKIDRKARKPWIIQEMIKKMGELRKWKSVSNEERRKYYRKLRNELKRAIDKAKKGYLEKKYDDVMGFQRTGSYDAT